MVCIQFRFPRRFPNSNETTRPVWFSCSLWLAAPSWGVAVEQNLGRVSQLPLGGRWWRWNLPLVQVTFKLAPFLDKLGSPNELKQRLTLFLGVFACFQPSDGLHNATCCPLQDVQLRFAWFALSTTSPSTALSRPFLSWFQGLRWATKTE